MFSIVSLICKFVMSWSCHAMNVNKIVKCCRTHEISIYSHYSEILAKQKKNINYSYNNALENHANYIYIAQNALSILILKN